MDSPCPANRWKPVLCSAALMIVAGCSEAVMMSQESDHGGVVSYAFKGERGGPMGSQYRKSALDLIQAKCGAGSRIVREGEIKGYTSAGMGIIGGTEDEDRGRRWGVQFECKTPESDITSGIDHKGK